MEYIISRKQFLWSLFLHRLCMVVSSLSEILWLQPARRSASQTVYIWTACF